MGFDFNSLIGQAQDAIQSGVKQLETQGLPALQVGLEKWGADVLNKQANETQAALNAAVAKQPPAPVGSLQYYLSGTVKNAAVAGNAIPILLGLGLVAFLVLRK